MHGFTGWPSACRISHCCPSGLVDKKAACFPCASRFGHSERKHLTACERIAACNNDRAVLSATNANPRKSREVYSTNSRDSRLKKTQEQKSVKKSFRLHDVYSCLPVLSPIDEWEHALKDFKLAGTSCTLFSTGNPGWDSHGYPRYLISNDK